MAFAQSRGSSYLIIIESAPKSDHGYRPFGHFGGDLKNRAPRPLEKEGRPICERSTFQPSGRTSNFQVTLPINTTYMRKSGGTSRIIWDRDNTSFYLPSRREAMALPDRLLTELSRIWLATLEFLSGTVSMTPIPRSSSRSLRHFAYKNCVPSFAIRPVLLAGHRVQTLLASTIRPRSRTLKFRVSIPRMIPGDLPPRFPADF